jgi:rod shape-determining protein MreD
MSYLLLGLALYLAPALDAAVMPHFQLAGTSPQLMLLAGLVWIALYCGRKAYIGAALAGLVADISGTGRLGIGFGLLTGLALMMQVLGRRFPLDRPLKQFALVSAGTAAGVLLISCLGPTPPFAEIVWPQLARWSAITGVYTAVVAWPLLAAVHRRRRHTFS